MEAIQPEMIKWVTDEDHSDETRRKKEKGKKREKGGKRLPGDRNGTCEWGAEGGERA